MFSECISGFNVKPRYVIQTYEKISSVIFGQSFKRVKLFILNSTQIDEYCARLHVHSIARSECNDIIVLIVKNSNTFELFLSISRVRWRKYEPVDSSNNV